MKRPYKYFFIAFILVLATFVFFNKKVGNNAPPLNTRAAQKENEMVNDISDKPAHGSKNTIWNGIDTFALEISREICKQEQVALSAIIDPPLNKVKGKDGVPTNSEITLSPSQATDWLKKTANSKCSSFRKDNAGRFFDTLVLNDKNYKQIYLEFGRILEGSQGLTPFKLLQKSLHALNNASNQEAKYLKDAILFSLSTYIKDAAANIDIIGAIFALKNAHESGLLSFPIAHLDQLQSEYESINKKSINDRQQLIRKYFPRDTNLLHSTPEQMADILGYEGIKAELEYEKIDYETVQKYAQKLSELLVKNF